MTTDKSATAAEPVGPWKHLSDRLDFSQYTPEPLPPAEERNIESERWGKQLILKSATGQYLQLSASDEFLWRNMDGERSVQDLVLLYFHEFESFAFDRISHLIGRLRDYGFLREPPIQAFAALDTRLKRNRPEAFLSRLASMFIEYRVEVRGLDKVLSFIYRWLLWPFFSRPAFGLYVIIAALGTAAFGSVLLQGRFAISDVFTSEGSVAYGAIALGIAFALMAAIHQLSHIFAAKALGREVPCAGFMLTYGLPFVFAQTTDVWLEGRRPRILSSLAGTISDVIVGATAALFLIAFPHSDWAPLAFKLAAVSYAALFMDLNPLFEMDGYYALEDYLEIPDLRSKSFAFVRKHLFRKLRTREPFNRQERIFGVYGVLALLWLAILVGAVLVLLVSKVKESAMDILQGSSVWSVVMAVAAMVFFVIPVAVALIAFGVLAVWRAVRWVRSHPALRDPHKLCNAILAGAGIACLAVVIVPWIAREIVSLPVASNYFGVIENALNKELIKPVWGLVFPAIVPGVFAASLVLAVTSARSIAGSRLAANLRLLAVFCLLDTARAALSSYTSTWGISTPAVAVAGVALEGTAWLALGIWAAHLLFGVEFRLMPVASRVALGLLAVLALAGAVLGALNVGGSRVVVAQMGLAAGGFALGAVALLPVLVNYSRTMLWPAWALLLAGLGLRDAAGLSRMTSRAMLAGIQVDLLGAVMVLFSLMLFRTVLKMSSVSVQRKQRQTRDEPGDRARLLDALSFIVESLGENLQQAYGRRTAASLQRVFNAKAKRDGKPLQLVIGTGDSDSALALDASRLEQQPIIEIAEDGRWALDVIEQQTRLFAGSRFFTQLMTAVYDELYWSEREPVYEHLLRELSWSTGIVRVSGLIETGIDALIEGTPLFEGLTLNERKALARTMRHHRARPGESIIREGEPADSFYLIADGEIVVYHDEAPDEPIATLSKGDYVGEASAMDGAIRSASARATKTTELLVLDRTDFRMFARAHVSVAEKMDEAKELISLLRKMPAFREVPLAQLALMASLMKPVRALGGEEVVRQGDIGSSMFIIREGQVEVLVSPDGSDARRVAVLGPGEYFGEIALVEQVPRTASVKAVSECELSELTKDDFDRRIGTSLAAVQAIGKISSRRRREIQERSTEFSFSFQPSPGPEA